MSTAPHRFTVGLTESGRAMHVIVEAEDALLAALKVKHGHPAASINYVRAANKRGDIRHPSENERI